MLTHMHVEAAFHNKLFEPYLPSLPVKENILSEIHSQINTCRVALPNQTQLFIYNTVSAVGSSFVLQETHLPPIEPRNFEAIGLYRSSCLPFRISRYTESAETGRT